MEHTQCVYLTGDEDDKAPLVSKVGFWWSGIILIDKDGMMSLSRVVEDVHPQPPLCMTSRLSGTTTAYRRIGGDTPRAQGPISSQECSYVGI